MKVVIISCSHRENSESLKVALFMQRLLSAQNHHAHLHDCGSFPLPLWTPDELGEGWDTWRSLEAQLKSTDALILITPEWHGMATPQAKNFFLLVGQSVAHKAGLLVAVSAGAGGAYPIAELRLSSYKNSKINWIPEHLIIRKVGNVLNESPSIDLESEEIMKSDSWIRDRITYALKHLELYSTALGSIRDQLPREVRFSNGM